MNINKTESLQRNYFEEMPRDLTGEVARNLDCKSLFNFLGTSKFIYEAPPSEGLKKTFTLGALMFQNHHFIIENLLFKLGGYGDLPSRISSLMEYSLIFYFNNSLSTLIPNQDYRGKDSELLFKIAAEKIFEQIPEKELCEKILKTFEGKMYVDVLERLEVLNRSNWQFDHLKTYEIAVGFLGKQATTLKQLAYLLKNDALKTRAVVLQVIDQVHKSKRGN